MSKYIKQVELSLEQFKIKHPESLEDVVLYSWIQSFSGSTLGFKGVGTRAITEAQVIVFFNSQTEEIETYAGGRFAYSVKPGDDNYGWIKSCFIKCNMPTSSDFERRKNE